MSSTKIDGASLIGICSDSEHPASSPKDTVVLDENGATGSIHDASEVINASVIRHRTSMERTMRPNNAFSFGGSLREDSQNIGRYSVRSFVESIAIDQPDYIPKTTIFQHHPQ